MLFFEINISILSQKIKPLFSGCVVTPNTGFEQAYEFMDCDTLVKQNGIAPSLRIPLKAIHKSYQSKEKGQNDVLE